MFTSFNRFKRIALALSAIVAVTGCATAKFDADRAGKVKKIAVVSFEIQQGQPTDNLGFSKFKEIKEGRPGDSKDLQAMAQNIYENLNRSIERKTGWKAIPLAQLKSQSRYKAEVDKRMSGIRNVTMGNKGDELIAIHGTLDAMAFYKMSQEDRVALAKSLGVDAFAAVFIINTIDQGYSIRNLTGDASFTFKGRANMAVYGLDSEEPIWRLQNIDGDETEESDTLPKSLTKHERLAKLGEKASLSALDKLVTRYGSK